MRKTNCIAMILAGGRGERLGSLTASVAKPAVTFGGKHKIIDFTLNNCISSGISEIGVLTQYLPDGLHRHIQKTKHAESSISLLPPQAGEKYSGTADAVFRNIRFIDRYSPEHVLILSGDHVYDMDYREMLDFHTERNADVTIASTPVPLRDAPRFGILNSARDGLITFFEEKPKNPKSNLASMGVYIFKWDCLKKHLISDSRDKLSAHDFGKNVIPKMLNSKSQLYTYIFNGYWKDIGTIYSLWEANMDILNAPSGGVPCTDGIVELHRSRRLEVKQSILEDYSMKSGRISNSVISENVIIGEGSVITDCVIMPHASIGRNVKLRKVIVGSEALIMDNAEIGTENGNGGFSENEICAMGVSLVAPKICISEGLRFIGNAHIDKTPVSEMPKYIPNNKIMSISSATSAI